MEERLQKILSARDVASRRAAEQSVSPSPIISSSRRAARGAMAAGASAR